eukprot:6333776-Pyramimonas_sp.AAC.1
MVASMVATCGVQCYWEHPRGVCAHETRVGGREGPHTASSILLNARLLLVYTWHAPIGPP